MYSIDVNYFDIKKIADSGQVFRMYPADSKYVWGEGNVPEGALCYVSYSADRCVFVGQAGNSITFSCNQEEYEEYWRHYFDLDRDYESMVLGVDESDVFLKNAAAFGAPIRLLNQNIWEMIISFIISQQKQIPSIRKCVEALSERFGEEKTIMTAAGEYSYHAFPTAEAIAAGGPSGLAGLSLGYRERYIYETACDHMLNYPGDEAIYAMPYEEVKAYMMHYCGVGAKVADCISLFGVGCPDAFPIDVHIKDILYREYYVGDKPKDKLSMKEYGEIIEEVFGRYTGYRGIVQQWIFAYELAR